MTKKLVHAFAIGSLIAGLTLPVLAQTPTPTPTPSPSPSASPSPTPRKEKRDVDLACMQKAVEKRDNAVIAALDAFYANMKNSLVTRRDALKAAFGITNKNERKTAIRTAWSTFEGTWRKTHKDMETAKRTAWGTYRTEAKACRGQGEDTRQNEGAF